MSDVNTICAFYSRGPHYVRMLKYLREAYPAARITAMVPPAYPREFIEGLADELVETPASRQGVAAVLGVIRQLRAQRFGLIAVMFDSPRLRLLASGSGASQRYCYSADGRFLPLKRRWIPFLLNEAMRRVHGHITYAYLHYVVHHRPVRK